MSSSRALAWLAMTMAPLMIHAGCSHHESSPCAWCDAGMADRSSDPPGQETTPIPDAEPEAAAFDQAESFDEEVQADQAEPSAVDGSQDGSGGEAAVPSPVPDGGIVLVDNFEDGNLDAWRTTDKNDAGMQDSDWSVIQGDTGSVYSEGVLDDTEWHIAYANVDAIADQIVEARMRVIDFYGATPSYVAALFARYDPSTDSGYFLALRGDGSVIIRKRVHGKSASWASGVDANIVPGAWHTVRLEVLGNTANAFLDGELVYSVIDSDPIAAGTAALGTYGATIEVDSIFLAQP
jgi:hypothetical protein